jgi:hypothetical protein
MSLDVDLMLDSESVFSYNITHNLNKMASEAGIYKCLWRPEEIEIKTAKQLIPKLEEGLINLKDNKESLEKFNPPNGWGTYDGLVTFVEKYLKACKMFPEAEVRASR